MNIELDQLNHTVFNAFAGSHACIVTFILSAIHEQADHHCCVSKVSLEMVLHMYHITIAS